MSATSLSSFHISIERSAYRVRIRSSWLSSFTASTWCTYSYTAAVDRQRFTSPPWIPQKVPFSASTLLVRWQEGHLAYKQLSVGLLVVMIWLELCEITAPVVTATSFIRSSNKIRNGDSLVLAYSGCPGKWPLNEYRYRRRRLCFWSSLCVYVSAMWIE